MSTPTHPNKPADKNSGVNTQLTTLRAGAVLLNRSPITYNSGLPTPKDIADFLDNADGSPGSGRLSDPDNGFLCWPLRGQTQQALAFAMTGADGGQATAIVGGLRSIRAREKTPTIDRVQWLPMLLDELTLTAGSEAGIADGLIDENDLWVDTIAVTKTYRVQPDPERLWGPKDASDALSPNNTIAVYIADMRGCEYGFIYVSRSTATGVKVIEFPF